MSSAGRALMLGMLLVGLASPAAAIVYEVNAAAVCPGSGTLAAPYCSIGNAAAVAVAGDIVNVAPGTYREQVTAPTSGSPGLPITYRSKAAGVRVLGTNLVTAWLLSSGTTYAAPYNPPTNPAQVFVDDVALTSSLAGANAVPVNGFFYDTVGDVLYVNLGGVDPNGHAVEAGARSFGFEVTGRTDIVVQGFEVRGQNTNGIRVRSSANVAIRGNRVLRAASFGIVADGTNTPAVTTTGPVEISGNEVLENGDVGLRLRNNVTQATVSANRIHHNANHGLSISNTTASVIAGNTFNANLKPGGVSTTGLLLAGDSDGNRVERNIAFDNQDSGFQVSGGADNNLFVRNISFANGDHGFDVRECDGTQLVSNTSYANANDGFSVEGDVLNAYLRNNIAAENGLLTGGNDLWVDPTSTVGFSADDDVFYRSSSDGNTIEYNGGLYPTVADFTVATGHEAHGTFGNPNFVNPAASDFHPGFGPAIDASDASAVGFQALDFNSFPPIDVLTVPNTGAGVPNFADRGALERQDALPVAQLTVTPKKARPGQLVTANGSASSDDVGIVSYRFKWGDGTQDTVQAGPIATHVFRKGNFKVLLTVTDGAGQTASVQQPVQVK